MDGRVGTRVALAARIGAFAGDWRDAIRIACHPLVVQGAITQHYEDRCVANVEEQGPYVVLAPGIALAHARPEDGVNTLALGCASLAQAVVFGHPDNDPVDVVLAFGSPDRDAHVGLLSALARSLVDGLADRLRSASGDEDARAILEEVIRDVE